MNNLRCWPVMVVLLLLFINVCLPAGISEAALQCYDCHGTRNSHDIRPEDASFRNSSSGGFQGNHRTHMGAAVPATCSKCHPGSDSYTASHRDGLIKLSSKINNSLATTHYPSFNNNTSPFAQTSNPNPGSCNSVNCHFEATTPIWGSTKLSSTSDCNTCHSAPPQDGHHPGHRVNGNDKHGDYLGQTTNSCKNCHPNHPADASPFAHATSVGKRPLSIQFGSPKAGGSYNIAANYLLYPNYLDRMASPRDGTCGNVYCHSDGRGGPPLTEVRWTSTTTTKCYSCHKGKSTRPGDSTPQVSDSTEANCNAILGIWSSAKGYCTPDLTISSNGHHRLVGPQWIRKYPCYYCHNKTVALDGTLTNISSMARHVNGKADVVMAPQWNIVGRPMASYSSSTKVCNNVYCHSDGTTDPEDVRPFAWTAPKTECNSCHGHPTGSCANANCHDGRTDISGKLWTVKTGWPSGSEWMGAMPMFPNQGAGTARANSHPRHSQTDFTCDNCHAATVANGSCKTCHISGIPPGGMGEVAHINAAYHVNKTKDVVFKDGGSYNSLTKTCSGTKCHTSGTDPIWGGSVNSVITCLGCHGTTGTDVDAYAGFNNDISMAKINQTQWVTSGHGRYSSSGRYPVSGNPAANFPGNPCWYCHDNNVLHGYSSNRFRLRKHPQYENRFTKECVYCHMEGKDYECLGCHNVGGSGDSLAPQLSSIFMSLTAKWPNRSSVTRPNHTAYATSGPSCLSVSDSSIPCHYVDRNNSTKDVKLHNSGAGFWTIEQKDDIKNQYIMMGVCLQCHDDDSGGQCTSCHTAPVGQPLKYSLGFDPGMEGTRFIKPKKARASGSHFGYKHYRAYLQNGVWKGGKFCWNCHDPHGDSNIYMIHDNVATTTDARQGVPLSMAPVSFTRKQSGLDYARTSAPYNGICNVCHSPASKHYTNASGDSHNASRPCTICHEHRFADSHADKQSCNTCHVNKKPIPKHTAFGLPRDCTKCHSGTIGKRMDIMGQINANSHHVQGVTPNNKHCYACHWESTPEGIIDVRYHEGYNYINYTSVKNAKVDLVVWKPGLRPTYYNTTTAIQFLASNIGTGAERSEAGKVSNHCLGCHSDQNNETDPFGDCKTPTQYAWDRSSIGARYQQTGTTSWGKYAGVANAAKKDLTKAFSAHGNTANVGGWSRQTGIDGDIPITRGGAQAKAVQCYDCHSSHGSKAVGITSSYTTFNGTKNGANLKETQAGKGGYNMSYKASSNTNANSVNPYNAGAGQCFDCHLSKNSGITPWGYNSTFGAISSIKGYRDTDRFGIGTAGFLNQYPFKTPQKKGGHMKASSPLTNAAMGTIDGLCTPCHDPHGVSPSLGNDQAYAVPLLKGTWMTSPYKEDAAPPDPYGDHITVDGNGRAKSWGTGYWHQNHPGPTQPYSKHNIDHNTFGGTNRIAEKDDQFAGLCLNCHKKENLTDGVSKNSGAAGFKTVDRIHESVKGWGANSEHSFTCSKCHQPHNSGLPRLMQTNCLDYKHRGNRASDGYPWAADVQIPWSAHSRGGEHRGYPSGSIYPNTIEATTACHVGRFNPTYNMGGPPAEWPAENLWNIKTPW